MRQPTNGTACSPATHRGRQGDLWLNTALRVENRGTRATSKFGSPSSLRKQQRPIRPLSVGAIGIEPGVGWLPVSGSALARGFQKQASCAPVTHSRQLSENLLAANEGSTQANQLHECQGRAHARQQRRWNRQRGRVAQQTRAKAVATNEFGRSPLTSSYKK